MARTYLSSLSERERKDIDDAKCNSTVRNGFISFFVYGH